MGHTQLRPRIESGRSARRICAASDLLVLVLASLVAASPGCDSSASVPAFTEPMTLAGEVVAPETLEAGRKLYGRYCASCHGADGSGQGPAAASLSSKPRDFREARFIHASEDPERLPTHEALKAQIRDGVTDRGMPAWKGLRDEDLDALARYVESFSPRWSEPISAAAATGRD